MKHLALVALVAATLVLSVVIPAAAAPNIYGTGGMIEVPDDLVYPVNSLTPAYHTIINIGSSDTDLSFYTVGLGIIPKLSISGGFVANGDSEALLNAKYQVSPETVDRPSITVGVVDALGKLNADEDPGLYIVVGKNLTSAAEEVAGGESKPLRGYLGFGTGTLEGLFLGLDWTLTPRVSAVIEYVNSDQGLNDDAHFNGGIRVALSNEIRLDLSMVDLSDFSAGISYNAIRF